MLINKYEKKKEIESSKISLKKKSRTAQKIENNRNEISASYEYDKRYSFNYHFISKTFIANITFFKIDEIKENRREYFKTNQVFFKKHVKVIYNIFKSTNEACDFFEQKYSTFINRMFFYVNSNLFTQAFIN